MKILIIWEKGNTKTTANETKEQKGGFLVMLLGTLGASLLVNMLTGKEILRGGYGNKKRKGMLKVIGLKFIFISTPFFQQKCRSIIKINPNLGI